MRTMKTTTLASFAFVATALSPIVVAAWQGSAIDWTGLLSAENLDERELHFDELVREAARDDELRARLDEWAQGQDELAWTARLARRELERLESSSPFRRGLGSRGSAHPRLDLDPFGDLGFGGGWPDAFFEDGAFERLFDELRARPGLGGGAPFERSSQRGFSLQQTPDGIRIEIQEEVDGDTQTKVYEGESLEELRQAHPELESYLGAAQDGGGPWRFGAGVVPFAWGQPRMVPFGRALGSTGPRHDRLGVHVSEPEDGAAGLRIHQVVPGSIAAELGLRAGETLLELDGRAIESVADVADALAARDRAATVTARVQGPDGERTVEWTPRDEPIGTASSPFPAHGTRRL